MAIYSSTTLAVDLEEYFTRKIGRNTNQHTKGYIPPTYSSMRGWFLLNYFVIVLFVALFASVAALFI